MIQNSHEHKEINRIISGSAAWIILGVLEEITRSDDTMTTEATEDQLDE